ncbi:hypothetical protein [Rubellicoccus peritrichatus]|uniref:Uncharacterized protein n=1 Tax=Rubellicoccus peritrichatus TaxID=3080537 RepID=A0AAQ3QWQ4_9BACT|nr:hypothetical protein [Puniceicoccus sp. CR14]WOO42137.1 hypothetical protein RZN69_03485 [Puniceicoccus sp. CR14]
MRNLATCLFCILTSLLLLGCGNSDEPAIKVDEAKVPKPTDESGSVQLAKQDFTIKFSAPSPAWSVKISEIWVVGEEIWVISDLSKKDGMAAQVITEISDSVTVEAPKIGVVYYLVGQTGGWKPDVPGVKLILNKDQIAAGLEKGFQIWPKS